MVLYGQDGVPVGALNLAVHPAGFNCHGYYGGIPV